jgi:iron complex transport system substrate-binding protein
VRQRAPAAASRWLRRRARTAALAPLLVLAVGSSCGPADPADVGPANSGPAGAAGPRALAAAATLGPPRRIVSMAPNLTETLFALGLGERVVAVDDFSAWPPEVARKMRIGGLLDPNLEKMVALHPDLVLLLPSERDVAAKLQLLGIATLVVPVESLADIERSFLLVAGRCGVPQAGVRLAAAWRAGLAGGPIPGAPRVMLSVDRQPGRVTAILAAARGTFLDELLALLGGVNVFADAASRYPQVGLEEVVARAPQVILELRTEPAPPAVVAALVADWRRLPTVPAVRDGRIVVIAGDYVLVPGPRVPQLYRRMREGLLAGMARAPSGPGAGGTAAPGGGRR